MVQSNSIRFTYPQGPEFRFPDIDLAEKEHLLILGPSGVGKTTLLHLLAGLMPPDAGAISIAGTELGGLGRKALDRFRGAHIGIVFQQYHFVQSLTGRENLRLRQRYPDRIQDRERLDGLTGRLGITDQLDRKTNELSQGQRQRLAIALGLIHGPKVVFADEPTANLDDANCDKVIGLLKDEANRCESSLVIITHDNRVTEHFPNRLSL